MNGGRAISGEAQTSIDVCKACIAGRYSISGEAQTSIDVCDNKCSVGKWSNQVGLVSDNDCTNPTSANALSNIANDSSSLAKAFNVTPWLNNA